jgi:hypothetical protein
VHLLDSQSFALRSQTTYDLATVGNPRQRLEAMVLRLFVPPGTLCTFTDIYNR